MRRVNFANGEIYHLYNRGVDKRNIFTDQADLNRFVESVNLFNDVRPAGSFYEQSLLTKKGKIKKSEKEKLVKIICFAFNPNHYHLLVEQIEERGIEKFMQKLGTGYTMFFNKKYKRSGCLFQGLFKSKHVDSNEYLLRLSAYINLNDKIHKINDNLPTRSLTSWGPFVSGKEKSNYCPVKISQEVILGQFKNKKEYKEFALEALADIKENKLLKKEAEEELGEDFS
ncbi:MAG: transposase [Candidatus Paceibacterota bacterium]|jgi:REP element-mobilizing transposase RayT